MNKTISKKKGTLIKALKGRRYEKNSYPIDYYALWYRDETGKKQMIFKDNPEVPFYIIKDKNSIEAMHPPKFIHESLVDKYMVTKDKLNKTIASMVPGGDEFYKEITMRNNRGQWAYEMDDIQTHPYIFGSDMDLDDYAVSEFMKEFEPLDDYKLHICYYDIEVDLAEKGLTPNSKGEVGYQGFPEEDIAPCPVSLITLIDDRYDNVTIHSFIYDNGLNPEIKKYIGNADILKSEIQNRIEKEMDRIEMPIKINDFYNYVYTNELQMLMGFMQLVHDIDPDVMSAWNAAFDYNTIYNRIKKLKSMTEFDSVYRFEDQVMSDSKYCENLQTYCGKTLYNLVHPVYYKRDKIAGQAAEKTEWLSVFDGIRWEDQLLIFASLRKHEGVRDSYKLDDIVSDELNSEKLKLPHGTTIKTVPWLEFTTFLEYNVRDAILLMLLSRKGEDYQQVQTDAEITHTSHSKIAMMTQAVKNVINRFANQRGYIMGNNTNARRSEGLLEEACKLPGPPEESSVEYREILSRVFREGGAVADVNLIDNVGVEILGKLSNKLFDNAVDLDLRALYPSLLMAFNMSHESLKGKFYLVDEKIRDNIFENYDPTKTVNLETKESKELKIFKTDVVDLGGYLVDSIIADNWVRVGCEYFFLPDVDEIVSILETSDVKISNVDIPPDSFKEKWFNEMFENISLFMDADQSKVLSVLEEFWQKRYISEGRFYNTHNYNKFIVTTEKFIDLFLSKDVSLSGFGAMFDRHSPNKPNILVEVIESLLNIRDHHKNAQKAAEYMSPEYILHMRQQLSYKRYNNSIYGCFSMPKSTLYEMSIQNSITMSGKDVITNAIYKMEEFLYNNIPFNDINVLTKFINDVKNQEYNFDILKHLPVVDEKTLNDYFKKKCTFDFDFSKLLKNMDDELRTKVYYKNNIFEIFENKQFLTTFKHIIVDQESHNFKTWVRMILEFSYHSQMMPDCWKFVNNENRKSVLVSDTDSIFVYIHPLMKRLMETLCENTDDYKNQLEFIKVVTSIIDESISILFDEFAENCGLSDFGRGKIYMKSEFVYKKLLTSEAKKHYAGLAVAEFGKMLPSPKVDIKGLPIKKSTAPKPVREAFTEILEEDILKADSVNALSIYKKFTNLETTIKESLLKGELDFGIPKSISDPATYKFPERNEAARGAALWNMIFVDEKITPGGRAMLFKLKGFKKCKSMLEKKYPREMKLMEKSLKTGIEIKVGRKFEYVDMKKFDLDVICVPGTVDNIPQVFIEMIDLDKMISSNMSNGQVLLKSLGVHVTNTSTVRRRSNIISI